MTDISVVIPVGPHLANKKWLQECFDSIVNQTKTPASIILIDDGADLFGSPNGKIGHSYPFAPGACLLQDVTEWKCPIKTGVAFDRRYLHRQVTKDWYNRDKHIIYSIFKTMWNVGVADAFNFGVALSQTNLVFLIGSDDIMYPTCLEECVSAYEKHQVEGWYNVTIETQSGDIMDLPNNTAMVTKKLWEHTGGFPPSAGAGGCDALLLSILYRHEPHKIIQVKQGTPLCWLREHAHQDTKHHAAFFNQEVISIRDKETNRWKPKN